jgi:hypothetical protein
MSIPRAAVRDIDKVRAIRAVLGFRSADPLAVEHVAREAAADADPESVAQLVLALTEMAALFMGQHPRADEGLREILLEYAKIDADEA